MRFREIFWAAFWLALAGLMVIYSKSNAADRRHAFSPVLSQPAPPSSVLASHVAPFLINRLQQDLAPRELASRSLASLRLAYLTARQQVARLEDRPVLHLAPEVQPAAPVTAPPAERDMAFFVVTDASAGCAPRCGRWIAGVGQITENSYARLKHVLDTTQGKPLPLILDSPGGQINAAISMGQLLRARHVSVSVAKTMLGPCDASKTGCTDDRLDGGALEGRLVADGARCVSACPFVFMGGERRMIEAPAVLGVHRVTMLKSQPGQTPVAEGFDGRMSSPVHAGSDGLPKPVRVRILRHLKQMGVDQELFDMMMRTPASKMDILSPLELDVYGVITGKGSASALVSSHQS